jgi:hypothetical protein
LKRLLVIPLLFAFFVSSAQTRDEARGLVFRKELSFGVRIPTQGWTIFADAGRFISVNQRRIQQFELSELRFPKEYKDVGKIAPQTGWPAAKPYYFGKQNNVYAFRYSVGRRMLIAEKGEKSGVEVRLTYLGGLSLAVLKPYYLFIRRKVGEGYVPIAERYTESNESDFTNPYVIYGAAGFTKGFDQIKPVPGLHGKIGMNFDWATYDDFIKAIEVGIMADLYYKEVPIMITQDNKQLFALLYFSVQFGRRW